MIFIAQFPLLDPYSPGSGSATLLYRRYLPDDGLLLGGEYVNVFLHDGERRDVEIVGHVTNTLLLRLATKLQDTLKRVLYLLYGIQLKGTVSPDLRNYLKV